MTDTTLFDEYRTYLCIFSESIGQGIDENMDDKKIMAQVNEIEFLRVITIADGDKVSDEIIRQRLRDTSYQMISNSMGIPVATIYNKYQRNVLNRLQSLHRNTPLFTRVMNALKGASKMTETEETSEEKKYQKMIYDKNKHLFDDYCDNKRKLSKLKAGTPKHIELEYKINVVRLTYLMYVLEYDIEQCDLIKHRCFKGQTLQSASIRLNHGSVSTTYRNYRKIVERSYLIMQRYNITTELVKSIKDLWDKVNYNTPVTCF